MTVTPGKVWDPGEEFTAAKMNQTAQPTVGFAPGETEVKNENIESVSWSKILGGLLEGNRELVISGATALLKTANFLADTDGVQLGNGKIVVNKGGGSIWRGLIDSPGFKLTDTGKVTIGEGDQKLTAAINGDFTFGDENGKSVIIKFDGFFFIGGLTQATAPFKVSPAGDFTLKNTAQSNHSISIGAIDTNIETPVIVPNGGVFNSVSKTITILSRTQGTRIYYTLNNTPPGEDTTLYTGQFNITATTTIRAVAIKMGERSEVRIVTITKGDNTTSPNPTLTPISGVYTPVGGNLSVTLRCSSLGSSMRYGLAGVVPTESTGTLISPANGSSEPTATIVLAAGERTVKVIAFKDGVANASQVVTALYIISAGGSPPDGSTGDGNGGTEPGGGGRAHLP